MWKPSVTILMASQCDSIRISDTDRQLTPPPPSKKTKVAAGADRYRTRVNEDLPVCISIVSHSKDSSYTKEAHCQ